MVQEIGMVAEWTLSGKEAVLRTKVAVEQNREFGAYIIAKVLGCFPFLICRNSEFSLTRKRGEKVHGSGRFFLAFFRGSVLE